MACPSCGCKEVYYYDADEDAQDSGLERCSACGVIFPFEAHAPEDDDGDEITPPPSQPGTAATQGDAA